MDTLSKTLFLSLGLLFLEGCHGMFDDRDDAHDADVVDASSDADDADVPDASSDVHDASDVCSDVTCSGFGQCVVESSTPWCDCNPGFHAVGLECVPDGTLDADVADAADADVVDASDADVIGLPACGDPPDQWTLALYRMEDISEGNLTDETTTHSGTIIGSVPPSAAGPAGCGQAFACGENTYGIVANSPDWNLTEGSIDLWVFIEALPEEMAGIVSRDALGSDLPGHLTLFLVSNGLLVLRVQQTDAEFLICSSSAVEIGLWHHVGVNVGPPEVEMFIDGTKADGTGPSGITSATVDCGATTDIGIDGNDNPWVFGASCQRSEEGDALPVVFFFSGSIDEVRISSLRRDFQRLAEN